MHSAGRSLRLTVATLVVVVWGLPANAMGEAGEQQVLLDVSSSPGFYGVGYYAPPGHSCVVDRVGGLRCWGANSHHQLGEALPPTARGRAALVPGLESGVTGVATGARHTCATLRDLSVRCFGDNASGQLGVGSFDELSIPAYVGIADVVQIGAGDAFTCALRKDGKVSCWGDNEHGQLGRGAIGIASSVPGEVDDLPPALRIAVGSNHVCAVVEDRSVYCWGANYSEQLGRPGDGGGAQLVQGTEETDRVFAGSSHSCALSTAGELRCWGSNFSGELGAPTAGYTSHSPVKVVGLGGSIADVALGGSGSCVVLDVGVVQCWGHLSPDDPYWFVYDPQPTPTNLEGIPAGVEEISLGFGHSCVRSADGEVSCWGSNAWGQIGTGAAPKGDPRSVPLLSGANNVAVGLNHHCALLNRKARCWGYNGSGALGNGTTESSVIPVQVDGVPPVRGVSVGGSHSCALWEDQQGVSCWGANASGQLGFGGLGGDWSTPLNVRGLKTPVSKVVSSAESSHTCAIVGDGEVQCWGANWGGQLGNGWVVGVDSPNPKMVQNLPRVIDVGIGWGHTCALGVDGFVYCWGDNFYCQSGGGQFCWWFDSSPDPRKISDVAGVVQLAVGANHTCARTDHGATFCWGDNRSGECGAAPDFFPIGQPVAVAIHDAQHVSAGAGETCAIGSTGQIVCWGALSSQDGRSAAFPVAVAGLPEAVASVSVGEQVACALDGEAKVYCWGRAPLGDGTTAFYESPVFVVGARSPCGNGVVDIGQEACDPSAVNSQCCTSECQLVAANTACRDAASECDVAELCDGVTAACPIDKVRQAGLVCRASGGVCDEAERCNGTSPLCPSDLKSTAICRPALGPCDFPESCLGLTDDCPADRLTTSGVACRAAQGVCDVAEVCSGASPGCPPDRKSLALCRTASGACDAAEFCNGKTNTCPVDRKLTGTVCRSASGVCDVEEVCDGVSSSCASDSGLPDFDADALCDVVDLCENIDGRRELRGGVSLSISASEESPGDANFVVVGKLDLPEGLTIDDLQLGASDVSVAFVDRMSGVLTELDVPAGLSDGSSNGWRQTKIKEWRYQGGNQGAVQGNPSILKVVITRLGTVTRGRIRMKLAGVVSDDLLDAATLPLQAIITFDVGGETLACGESSFGLADCARSSVGVACAR